MKLGESKPKKKQPRSPSAPSPKALLKRWRGLEAAGRAAAAKEDAVALAECAAAAEPVRRAMEKLNPADLAGGIDLALQIAAAQAPGRRELWYILLADELRQRGELELARKTLLGLAPLRLSNDAVNAVAPILALLVAADPDPDLLTHLAQLPLRLEPTLKILAATAEVEQVTAVGRCLEAMTIVPCWESSMSGSAMHAGRPEVIESLLSVIVETVETDSGSYSPADRRELLLMNLGETLLKAGDGPGALDAWLRIEGLGNLRAYRVKALASAGFADEAQRLYDSLSSSLQQAADISLGYVADVPGERKKPPLEAALAAARAGDGDRARAHLAEAEASRSRLKPAERAWSLVRAARVLRLLGDPEAATAGVEAADTIRRRVRSKAAKADTSTAAVIGRLIVGDHAGGAELLLRAVGLYPDHDTAYDALQEAVDAVADGGAQELEAFLEALPPPGDEIFFRERLVAYVASALAHLGEEDAAFAAAHSIEDPIDRSDAMEHLTMAFLAENRLAEAEQAALEIAHGMGSYRLGELAAAYVRAGDQETARRLYSLAFERAGSLASAGRLIVEAAAHGFGDAVRPLVARSIPELLLEDDEDDARWIRMTPDQARKLLAEGTYSQSWRFHEVLMKVTTGQLERPSDGQRVYLLAQLARALLAEGNTAEAEEILGAAIEDFEALASSTMGFTPLHQMSEAVHALGLAASEAGIDAARLLVAIRWLAKQIDGMCFVSSMSRLHRNVAFALGDLGAWAEAVEVAAGATYPRERIEALRWIAACAPLRALAERWTVFVDDRPLVPILLARLGFESTSARAVARPALRQSR